MSLSSASKSLFFKIGTAGICLLPIGCTQVTDTVLYGSETASARDQIMLVRKDPPSFGYKRLETQIGIYPELGSFVYKHGIPNFLAETGTGESKYFILYYLREREAFACRTLVDDSRAIECAGPYPITDREFRMLDAFRRDPSHKPPRF